MGRGRKVRKRKGTIVAEYRGGEVKRTRELDRVLRQSAVANGFLLQRLSLAYGNSSGTVKVRGGE